MKQKKNKILLITLIVILVFLNLLVGCSNNDNNTNGEDAPFYSTDEDVFVIKTPYCDLQYPTKWKDKIVITNGERGECYVVSFFTSVDENTISLFDIIFGGDEGSLLGTLEIDNKSINIYIIEHALDLEQYTEEQQIEIGGMNNDVNVIISKLLEQYNFEIAM